MGQSFSASGGKYANAMSITSCAGSDFQGDVELRSGDGGELSLECLGRWRRING